MNRVDWLLWGGDWACSIPVFSIFIPHFRDLKKRIKQITLSQLYMANGCNFTAERHVGSAEPFLWLPFHFIPQIIYPYQDHFWFMLDVKRNRAPELRGCGNEKRNCLASDVTTHLEVSMDLSFCIQRRQTFKNHKEVQLTVLTSITFHDCEI